MVIYYIRLSLSSVAILLVMSCGRTTPARPLATTVCSIVAKPWSWDNKTVEFDASVSSDGLERTTLHDNACADGLLVVRPTHHLPTKLDSLKTALFSVRRGTFHKAVTGHFVGIVKWKPITRRSRTIELIEASNIQVTPK
jgi:hypothetical protein